LVATGAALFTVIGLTELGAGPATGDPTRMAAQVVSGLGFIGAGAILRDGGGGVRGLTTAATLWVSGALGVVFATGNYVLAGGSIAIVLVVLVVLRSLRSVIGGVGRDTISLEVHYEVGHGTLGPIMGAVEISNSTIEMLTLNDTKRKNRADERGVELTVSGRKADLSHFEDLIQSVHERPEVSSFEMYRGNE
jgi:putative Mg2+ transporter-C (MgtC) family protein